MERDSFYQTLPRTRDFAALATGDAFAPLPKGWHVGCADIVNSTALIAAGRYKTVNMIGAAVISALTNVLKEVEFPFVFGGDGASFAVPPGGERPARAVLAQMRSWVASEFDIELRAALLPVSWVRAEGLDVKVARYAPSDGVHYAMFSGGGLAWAESQMKAGGFAVLPDPAPEPPDLSGLSCRWTNAKARNGTILSLVMLPSGPQAGVEFAQIAAAVVDLAGELDRSGHPLPLGGPPAAFPPPGLPDEARLTRTTLPYLIKRLLLLGESALAAVLFWCARPVRGFDPLHYRTVLSANADFRKFDDGLKMTLDCNDAVCNRLKALLSDAAALGHIRYGLHEQSEAMITCVVPSLLRDDHMHFVDGAAGGYTAAAAQIR